MFSSLILIEIKGGKMAMPDVGLVRCRTCDMLDLWGTTFVLKGIPHHQSKINSAITGPPS